MLTTQTAEYSVKNIVKSFGGAKALAGVSMSVSAEEVHCLAGENGSGKSTLIKIMSGVHAPDSGVITLAGKEFAHLSPRQAVNEGVQVIFQDFSLLPNLTVAENIALPTNILKSSKIIGKKETRRIAEEALGHIGVDIDINSPLVETSIASKQLIAIARATNLGVKMLFMDEPTTALTRKEVKKLFEVVDQLRKRGVAIVFVSHKIDEIQEICNTITVLRNGEVAAEGLMSKFKAKEIATAMTGSEIATSRIAPLLGKDSRPLLELENVTSKNTFNDVSFSISEGEIIGLTGLLGSGRTELAEAIFGKYPVDAGCIKVDGKEVTLNSPEAALASGIGYVPPDRLTQGLFLEQSILRNIVAVGLDRQKSRLGAISKTKISENWKLLDLRT